MVPAVRPEQFREIENFRVARRIDALRMCGDSFENPFLAQSESRGLVVDDRVDGDGGLAEPVSQGLLLGRELAEAFRFELDEGGGAGALDQSAILLRLCAGG